MHWPRSQKRGEPEEGEQHSCGCSETGCGQVGSAGSAVDELNDVPLGIRLSPGPVAGQISPKNADTTAIPLLLAIALGSASMASCPDAKPKTQRPTGEQIRRGDPQRQRETCGLE